jgi:hypothetical protein
MDRPGPIGPDRVNGVSEAVICMSLRFSISRCPIAAAATLLTLALTPTFSIPAQAAAPASLTGQILGEVRNTTGISQMGASVFLYNRYDELVRQSFTNAQGRFAFDSLTPDLYTIRVILASFMPAERRSIAVSANSENLLQINLASVLSTVDIAPATSLRGTLMTEEWKWVLRSSQSTRPVLRFLPEETRQASRIQARNDSPVFNNTTGVLKLSAGEGQSFARGGQQDLGTAFAIATSLAGDGRVQVSGNLGLGAANGMPAAGFRTSYSRPSDFGTSPEVTLTMRQLYVTPRTGTALTLGSDNAPALRTMSLAFTDTVKIESLRLDYGFDFQSISYLDRLNYASPFMRASYDLGSQGVFRAAYSSGAPPVELLSRSAEHYRNEQSNAEQRSTFDQDLAALSFVPRLSRSNGRLALERTQNMEAGYERVFGSRTVSVSAYQERASNAAFMLSAPVDFLDRADLLPDLGSSSSIFNAGSFRRNGYTVAIKQNVGDHAEISVAAGRTGVLRARSSQDPVGDASELQAGFRQGQRPWVTVRASGRLPFTGTNISTNYGWTDFSTLMPLHLYVTQAAYQDIGLNVFVRQPLPAMFGLPWRMELTGELRNILAQGYLSVGAPGNRAVLTNSPKAVRGGLSFIF